MDNSRTLDNRLCLLERRGSCGTRCDDIIFSAGSSEGRGGRDRRWYKGTATDRWAQDGRPLRERTLENLSTETEDFPRRDVV